MSRDDTRSGEPTDLLAGLREELAGVVAPLKERLDTAIRGLVVLEVRLDETRRASADGREELRTHFDGALGRAVGELREETRILHRRITKLETRAAVVESWRAAAAGAAAWIGRASKGWLGEGVKWAAMGLIAGAVGWASARAATAGADAPLAERTAMLAPAGAPGLCAAGAR